MDFSEEVEISSEEMGIDAKTFEERFDELGLFIENHSEAILAARKCYKEWVMWNDHNKTDFAKEKARLLGVLEDAEQAQVKTYEALQIAVMGEEAWLEVKRRMQEEDDAYDQVGTSA